MFNTTLIDQYSSGVRYFNKIDLAKADLENTFLSRVEMKQGNFDYANLKNADFSDANLTESTLVGAELSKAHLSGINLSKANLSKANLTRSILNQANLSEACLEKACLASAVLIKANLMGADLSGADLSTANLTNANLKGAIYDNDTSFPIDFDPQSKEMLGKFSIEDLVAQFNSLCECSAKYLGNVMTAKYFNSSRPDRSWLTQFTLDKSSRIIYQGNITENSTSEQLRLLQQWKISFIKSCSSIVKEFEKLI